MNSLYERAEPITEVSHIDEASFREDFVHAHKPLILREAIANWPAMSWDDAVLTDRLQFQNLKVDRAPARDISGPDLAEATQDEMTVRDFIAARDSNEDYYYILDHNFPPPLFHDIRNHPLYHTFPVSRRLTFWWGKNGQSSYLHYDDNENVMCQIAGAKQFLLFDVTDTPNLYPKSWSEYRSSIDPCSINEDDWPLLRKAKPYIATLYPGDAMYVPCYWWHLVRSSGNHIAISHIINESLEQRMNVTEKLLRMHYLNADAETESRLVRILTADLRPAEKQKQLKAVHAEWKESQDQTYYPHGILHRLIEESLTQVLYGHATH